MKLVQVKVSELFGSEVLARSVFWKQQLFMARGSILTKKMISLLKRNGVQYVCVETPISLNKNSICNYQKELERLYSVTIGKLTEVAVQDTKYNQQFIEIIFKLSYETSYCYEFNVADEIKALSTFFVISMQNEQSTSLSENEASVNVDVVAFSFLFLRYEHRDSRR